MTALRDRMIQDMQLRGLVPGTQKTYVDAIRELAKYYHRSPDLLSEEDIRDYFIYLREEKNLAGSTMRNYRLPESLWQNNWVVYCKPAIQGPDKVLRYLARYVHRVAIPNSRIISIEKGNVTFRYMPLNGSGPRTMTLGAEEFIRRFLQHVLPKGVHKVRYYGLWAPANRKDFDRVRDILAVDTQDLPSPPDVDNSQNQRTSMPQQCPRCKTGRLVWQARIPRYSGAPPPS